jgi:hypothetical protein
MSLKRADGNGHISGVEVPQRKGSMSFQQAAHVRRREFIALVGASITWPFAAEAQLKVHRIALVFSTAPVAEMAGPEPVNPYARVFVRGLHALGYVEGQNLILYRRSAEGQFSRYRDIIARLSRGPLAASGLDHRADRLNLQL